MNPRNHMSTCKQIFCSIRLFFRSTGGDPLLLFFLNETKPITANNVQSASTSSAQIDYYRPKALKTE